MVETISSSSANLTVENSSVHNYNKNGIVARYAGANLIATGNYVQGSGPIDVIAQNGIELAFDGATGSIKNNTVIDNFYTPNTSSSADILLYDAKEYATIAVSGNTLGNSNYAVSLVTTTPGTYGDGVSVTTNKIFGTSTFDAIDVCTNANIITGNTIFNSSESGIHLDASWDGHRQHCEREHHSGKRVCWNPYRCWHRQSRDQHLLHGAVSSRHFHFIV